MRAERFWEKNGRANGNPKPLFIGEWDRALFIHFEVDAGALQAEAPFRLDLREGKAYVSLVAFIMRRMRPCRGGRLAEWCFSPIATHELLNLRTYVRHRGEAGIYFLAEWIPNPLSAFLGPRTFGLPYRLGILDYEHCHEKGSLRGRVESAERDRCGEFVYSADLGERSIFSHCVSGSLDEFLLERYIAFTEYRGKRRFFRVWHAPWPQVSTRVSVSSNSLLRSVAPCLREARLVGANYSPGVQNVRMGWPNKVPESGLRRSLSAWFEMP